MKKIKDEYKYGFSSDVPSIINTGKGLNEAIIRNISEYKKEPLWMLEYRLDSYKKFLDISNPSFGPNLNNINFQDFIYYARATDESKNSWEDVPSNIKETFEKLGIPEAEKKFLAGVSTQFESEVVYHSTMEELNSKGVIFLDTDTALKEHEELFKAYFAKLVKNTDNKYSALNGAVWSGGSFIYVPKGVHIEKPLQSYFRINQKLMGQFERTIIIVDEGADLTYIEGCTAPIYTEDSLHAAVVEVFVNKDAKCRYTTIQNWSSNVINLVTKRSIVYENGLMEWVDGNIGSRINMKYPSCDLVGNRAKGTMLSIAFASKNQFLDAGAIMRHLAPNTTSNIVSKSVARTGGVVNYRGRIFFDKEAINAKSHVECDTMLLDSVSRTDTIPINIIRNNACYIEHEATISKINEEQLFYLMSRGLKKEEAIEIIIVGFIEPFAKELPMEYAVELSQLIKLEMGKSHG